MAEDLKSKLAAIAAAKESRVKQQETAERVKIEQAAEKEKTLLDKAKELESKVKDAEVAAKEAEESIQQADAMLAEGGLEAEEVTAIGELKKEAEQKIVELKDVEAELAAVKKEIEGLKAEQPLVEEVPQVVEVTEKTVKEKAIEELSKKLEAASEKIKNLWPKRRLARVVTLIQDGKEKSISTGYLKEIFSADSYVDGYLDSAGERMNNEAERLGILLSGYDGLKRANRSENRQDWLEVTPGLDRLVKEVEERIEQEKPAGVREYEKIITTMSPEEIRNLKNADLDKDILDPEPTVNEAKKRGVLANRRRIFERGVGMDIIQFYKKLEPEMSEEDKKRVEKGEAGFLYALRSSGVITGIKKVATEGPFAFEIQRETPLTWKAQEKAIEKEVLQPYKEELTGAQKIFESARERARSSPDFKNDKKLLEDLAEDTKELFEQLKKE